MSGNMTKKQKALCWFLGVPAMSIAHCIAAVALLCLFAGWGEDIGGPPSAWITMPLAILFHIMAPFYILVGYLDYHIIRMRDYWYAISIGFSSILWWSLVAWIVTQRPIQRWKQRRADDKSV